MSDPHGNDVPPSPLKPLGDELRRLRNLHELTTRELARLLKVRSHTSIVDWENGVRLPSIDAILVYESKFDLDQGLLMRLREQARLARDAMPRDGVLAKHLAVACPYKGLRAFELEDATWYFGREQQVADVLEQLESVPFVAIVGASGSGKSSFLRAGILASLARSDEDDGARRVVLLTPGTQPLEELARSVTAALGGEPVALTRELRTDPRALERAARRGGRELVIAVDQFEELFTLCGREADRRAFIDALTAAWRAPARPVIVLLGLRADFYGRVATHAQLKADVLAYQALIGPMGTTELKAAIEKPAARSGLALEGGLVDTILYELKDAPGGLPLLSHALAETFERKHLLKLTLAGYREAGGVRHAIEQTAERTLKTLSEAEQAIARSIFVSLTNIGDGAERTRRRVARDELAGRRDGGRVDHVLGILADARLVSVDKDTVIVAHEALIRHWWRLRDWIDVDRAGLRIHRRLTDAAREWDALERERGVLYRGARLVTAREWAADHADDLIPIEGEFLAASDKAERRELREAKRTARRMRDLATEATSLALAASAMTLLGSRPDIGLILAFESYRERPSVQARSSVIAALAAVGDPAIDAVLRGHAGDVCGIAIGPDGQTLLSAGGGEIRRWDVSTRTSRAAWPIGVNVECGISLSPDGRTVVYGAGNRVRLLDIAAGDLSELEGEHVEHIYDVAFSPDGHTIASACPSEIRLWDVRTGQPLGAPLGGLLCVAFSPDGRQLAFAGSGGIHVVDVATSATIGRPLAGASSQSSCLAFSPDGRALAAGTIGGTVHLLSLGTERSPGTFEGHSDIVEDVAFSPDGHTLASASRDRTIRLWNPVGYEPHGQTLRGHTDSVTSLAFGRDARTLASAGNDRSVRLWNVGNRESGLGATLAGHTDMIERVTFSPDGRTMASASFDGTVVLWDVRTRRMLGTPLTGHNERVYDVEFSPDGRMLASAGADRTVRIWDVRAGAEVGAPLAAHANWVTSVAFTPDGALLAAAADNAVRLWDLRTRELARAPLGTPVQGAVDSENRLAISPDGRTLACTGDDYTIRLWDPRSGIELGAPLTGSWASRVAFSGEGTMLAFGHVDKTVRLWDVHAHQPFGDPLTGHTDLIYDVAFSPDGRTLASGSYDRTVRLWDIPSCKPIGIPLEGQSGYVTSVAFSPDGRTLASADNERIRLWGRILWHDLAELRDTVRELVGTGLSKAEWAQYAGAIPYRDGCA